MEYTKAELIILPIAFLSMLGIALFLRRLLLNKPEKIQKIPFIIIAILMLVGEFAKQIRGIIVGYNLWWLPLHFCSAFFLWFSLAEFTKGEFARRMRSVAFLATLCLFVAMYFNPRSIIGNACENIFSSFLSAHTFFFHHLAIFYFLLSLALNRVHIRKTDAYFWAACMLAYFAVATIFAYALKVNYFSILYCFVEILENFRLRVGQIPYNLFQACVLILLPIALIFFMERLKRIATKHQIHV